MATTIAILAYLSLALCYLGALLLGLEWLAHSLPGAWLNFIRRSLFKLSFPLVAWSEEHLAFEIGAFRSRGLLLAVALVIVGRFGVPWLILASFSLRS